VLFVSERVGILDRNHRAQLSPLKTPNKPTAYDCHHRMGPLAPQDYPLARRGA
jgi:hypothetical protein